MVEYRHQATALASNNEGFALIVVMVVLLLTSFLASELIFDVRTEQRIALNAKERERAAMLSAAGINIALFRLMDKPVDFEAEAEFGTLLPGRQYTTFLENGKVSYYAANESGKIDLNVTPPGLLELFLQFQGLTGEQVSVVADSLLDWKDTDALNRLNGAEQEYYQALPEPYIPRNGRIEDPAEFFLIRGTGPLYGRFELMDVFTVNNTEKKINFNSLTPAMLDFVVDRDEDRRKAYYEAKEASANLNPAHARQILGDERYALFEPFLGYSEGGASRMYSIVATAETGVTEKANDRQQSVSLTIHALVRLLANGYQVLSWKEQYS